MEIKRAYKCPLDFVKKALYFLIFHSFYNKWLIEHNLKKALNMHWHYHFNSSINWDNPQTFNEKMQYLQLYQSDDLWSTYADKYEVRRVLSQKGLDRYLSKLYGVWDSVEEIDFNNLPNSFVIKCTHDCGSTYIIRDKGNTDLSVIKAILCKKMKVSYGLLSGEPHYLKIKHRIIAEEYLNQGDGMSLVDYKFCCIHGIPKFCMVCFDRPASGMKGHAERVICDLNPWNPNSDYINEGYSSIFNQREAPEPDNLTEMISLATILSKEFPLVYVDMYNINGRIVFGEMTFTRDGGRILYLSDEYQKKLGEMIQL